MSTQNFTIDRSVNISHAIYMLFLLGAIVTVYSQTQSKLEVHAAQISALQEGLKTSDIRAGQRADRTDDKIDALRTVVETKLGGR